MHHEYETSTDITPRVFNTLGERKEKEGVQGQRWGKREIKKRRKVMERERERERVGKKTEDDGKKESGNK